MSNLPSLLRRQKELFKQFLELEREIADLDRQIITAGTTPPAVTKPRRRAALPNGGVTDAIREMLLVLQGAGVPLAPRELALRMGVEAKLASRYLAQALKLKLVERAGNARYRVIAAVPNLQTEQA